MRRLLIFRHARAVQADKDTPKDADRPLAESGRRDAADIGAAMRQKGYSPDVILCSPSVRTRQTLECARGELGTGAEVEFADAIYNASVAQLLALVQDLGDGVSQAMIVGHNPGFEELAALLVRPEDAKSLSPAPGKERFPTAGLLLLDFNIVSWADVAPHTGALADFLKPEQISVR